jgi:hypothetical protein
MNDCRCPSHICLPLGRNQNVHDNLSRDRAWRYQRVPLGGLLAARFVHVLHASHAALQQ